MIPAAVVVIAPATVGFLLSPYFALRTVVFKGHDRAILQELARTVHLPAGANTVFCNVSRITERVEQCPRVLSATGDRDLPSEIVIHVREREPAFALKSAHGYVFVDRYGILLMHTGDPPDRYPRVYDNADLPRTLGGRLNDNCLQTVLSCMVGARRCGMGLDFSLDVARPYDYRLRTPRGTLVKLGGPRNLVRKVMMAHSIERHLRERGKIAAVIDVRLPTKPCSYKLAEETTPPG